MSNLMRFNEKRARIIPELFSIIVKLYFLLTNGYKDMEIVLKL